MIVIAGKVHDEVALDKQIQDIFGTLPEKKKISKPPFVQTLPTDKVAFYDKKTEQNHLVISAPGFDGNNEHRYAANVLATILGGNMSSRLFQNIREKQGLCYYIQAKHMSSQDTGFFLIRAGIDKERFDF
ncbi:MAG: insulinase family protein [bacterium]